MSEKPGTAPDKNPAADPNITGDMNADGKYNNPNAKEVPPLKEEDIVYEGEVIGYDLFTLADGMIREIEKLEQEKTMSRRTAFICATLLSDWSNSLRQNGVTTIQLPENL